MYTCVGKTTSLMILISPFWNTKPSKSTGLHLNIMLEVQNNAKEYEEMDEAHLAGQGTDAC
jgi:hypothetical protein